MNRIRYFVVAIAIAGFIAVSGQGPVGAQTFEVGDHAYVEKTTDQSKTFTTTRAGDTELLHVIQPGEKWEWQAFIVYRTGTTADFKMRFIPSINGTTRWNAIGPNLDLVNYAVDQQVLRENTEISPFGGNTTDRVLHVRGVVHGSPIGGVFGLEWAQNVATTGATIVRAGSYLTMTKVDEL